MPAKTTPIASALQPGDPVPVHFSGCFACGDVEGGLRMRGTVGPGETILSVFEVRVCHQGAPGIAHGGVLAAAFDEALGMLAHHFRTPAVTGRLQTEFRRPVPVGAVLHIETRIDGRAGRKIMSSGTGRLDAPDGPVAVTATAVFVTVSIEHFARHGRPAEVEAAQQEWQFRS